MAQLGKMEIEYYQLTPVGMQRIQSGALSRLGPEGKQILKELAQLGGAAELDELKAFGTYDSPMVLRKTLSDLVDLGYVTSVALTQPGQQVA